MCIRDSFWGPVENNGPSASVAVHGFQQSPSQPTPSPPAAAAAAYVGETLCGEIRRITYHNPDNQWTVARLVVAKSHVDVLPLGATAGGDGNGGGGKYGKYRKKKGSANKKGGAKGGGKDNEKVVCLLYTSPSPRDATLSRMPSSA